jgi:hypothetical protein
MGLPGTTVSRRGLIAIAVVAGVSGCGLSFDDKVAKDPYISLIKTDPMFSWAPPGKLTRTVTYSPLSDQPLANQQATAVVVYYVPDAAKIPDLVKLAFDASLANGYNSSGKRDAGGIVILLSIQTAASMQGVSLIFQAPSSM